MKFHVLPPKAWFFFIYLSPLFSFSGGPGRGDEQAGVITDKAVIPVKAQPGTYQFLVSGDNNGQAYTNDVLVAIEKLRDDTKEVRFPLDEQTTVRILPRTVINKPGFVPVPEVVIDNGDRDTERDEK
jgi:hypothetical protein